MAVFNFKLLAWLAVLFALTGVGASVPSCCRFEVDDACTDLWNGAGWILDSNKIPSPDGLKYPIPSGTDYDYSQNTNGATFFSPLYSGITNATTFAFHYYGDITTGESAPNSHLTVSFVPVTGEATDLGVLGDTLGSWQNYSVDCEITPCCGAGVSTCDGRLVFVTTYYSPTDSILVAIDDVETDNGCNFDPEYPTCCRFEITESCTETWAETGGTGWNLSSEVAPTPDGLIFPIPKGDYEWSKNVNGATLYSPQFKVIRGVTTFGFQYYGDVNPITSFNTYFNVYFNTSGYSIPLGTLGDTGGNFYFYSIDCFLTSCCAFEAPTCEGTLLFEVTYLSGENGLFAVDDVESNSGCGMLI